MAEEKSVFERLDDISAGQSAILGEITGVKTQVTDTDNRITELEAELKRLKSAPTVTVTRQNDQEILQTFLKKAKKSWRWFGTLLEFKKIKKLATVSLIILLAIGLITTIVSSVCFQMYSTFTLFENAWMICGIVYLVYAIKSQYIYEVNALVANSPSNYEKDKLGMAFPKKEKVVFKIFKWLAIISVVCNIICIWAGMGKGIKVIATIMEVLFLGTIIFAYFMNLNLYAQYSIIWVEGHNLTTNEKVVLVLPPGAKQLMLEEDFKKKMLFFYD